MPCKPRAKPVDLPAIPAELLEQFGSSQMTAEAIKAATLALKKALIEWALGGEMNHHLGCPQVPRDRDGRFEPLLIPKHERRFKGFDDKIVAMYAPRHDRARNPELPAGAICNGSLARVHQLSHR